MERRKSSQRKKRVNKTAQKRNNNYRAVISFFEKNNRWPSATAKNEKELSLGQWVVRVTYLKRHHPERLPEKVIKLIERIEFDRSRKYDIHWNNVYSKLVEFIEREKRWPSPNSLNKEECSLHNWCTTQKSVRKHNLAGSLNEERIKLLDSIGFIWSINKPKRSWNESFALLKNFIQEKGRWPVHTADEEENRLAKWCSKMRAYKSGADKSLKLTPGQIRKLTNLGLIWETESLSNGRTPEQLNEIWKRKYNEFCEFIIKNKHYPKSNSKNEAEKSLYTWWMRMAYLKRYGKLREDRIEQLNNIGFRWGRETPDEK